MAVLPSAREQNRLRLCRPKTDSIATGPLQAGLRTPLQLGGHIANVVSLHNPADIVNEGNPSAVLHLALDCLIDLRDIQGEKDRGNWEDLGKPSSYAHFLTILAVDSHDSPVAREAVGPPHWAFIHSCASHLAEQTASDNARESSGHAHRGNARYNPSPLCILDLGGGHPDRIHRRLFGPAPVLAWMEAAQCLTMRVIILGYDHSPGQLPAVRVHPQANVGADDGHHSRCVPTGEERMDGQGGDTIGSWAPLAAGALESLPYPDVLGLLESPARGALRAFVAVVWDRGGGGDAGQNFHLVLVSRRALSWRVVVGIFVASLGWGVWGVCCHKPLASVQHDKYN